MNESGWLQQPTHINFITTFKNKHRHQGYWFLTWISGPNRITVWRKTLDDSWKLETGGDPDWWKNIYPKLDPNLKKIYSDNMYKVVKELDRILYEYMEKNNFKGYPYEYWKPYREQIETALDSIRRGEPHILANTKPEVPELIPGL